MKRKTVTMMPISVRRSTRACVPGMSSKIAGRTDASNAAVKMWQPWRSTAGLKSSSSHVARVRSTSCRTRARRPFGTASRTAAPQPPPRGMRPSAPSGRAPRGRPSQSSNPSVARFRIVRIRRTPSITAPKGCEAQNPGRPVFEIGVNTPLPSAARISPGLQKRPPSSSSPGRTAPGHRPYDGR